MPFSQYGSQSLVSGRSFITAMANWGLYYRDAEKWKWLRQKKKKSRKFRDFKCFLCFCNFHGRHNFCFELLHKIWIVLQQNFHSITALAKFGVFIAKP